MRLIPRRLRGPSTTRVVIAILGLIAVAFAASGILAVRTLKGELQAWVDERILTDARSMARALDVLSPEEIAALGADSPTGSSTTAFMIIGPDGNLVSSRHSGSSGHLDALPELPSLGDRARSGTPFTIDAESGDLEYRAVVATVGADTVVVAAPLDEMQKTVRNLAGVLLLIGVIVVALLGLFIWALVATENRRVDHMIDTATQIGDGDLTARIDQLPANTAAGRLGHALNEMLSQLEAAFVARQTSDERLRRFAADASHELRTPLTHIRGYAELLRTDVVADPDDQRRALNRIEAEAARMTVLVEDLLLLTRLDQHQRLESEPVDLRAMVVDAVDDARVVEPLRPIALVVPDTEVVVLGDEARLRQVMGILLTNIRVHTDPDSAAEIGLVLDGDRAVLTVTDHGRGMTPDVASKVFDRFYRPENSRSRATGGSGLGLAIARDVIAAHGGTLELRTEVGQGSTFTATLAMAELPLSLPDPASL